ncbi:MAG: D-glycero-beta-D-manno-heptose-7-phosphate kinase [Acidobacteriota bacterium]|nr:D-glycero-beta-D-manno-heptose-7-phosphate kinase [Acidobacteriota bacterium]
MEITENFSKVKVLIVGDIMLDRYWWGSVSRISPEAPVPVVTLDKISLLAGGAANVAANVAGLGAKPYLVGVIGEDGEAKVFTEVLREANISYSFLVPLNNRQTTVKTRIVAHNQQVVRIDQESTRVLSKEEEQVIFKKIETIIDEVNIVIISDYAKGLITEKLAKRLITTTVARQKKILVDPKGKDYSKYMGATLLTPNQKEAVQATNLDEYKKDSVEKSGNILLESLSLEALLITRGEKGMTLFQKNKKITHLKALARKVYDVTGAGDTVIAVLAVMLASGADFREAANIANISAGLVVEQIGTTAISLEVLQNVL